MMIRVIVDHVTKSKEDSERLMSVIVQLRNEAMKQPGYITGETLINNSDPTHVLVISTWNSRETWDAWDHSEARTKITQEGMLPLLKKDYTVSQFDFARVQRGRVVSIT
jgi:heme-degrading monooxygenase HmoA